MKSIIRYFVNNPRLVNLLLVLVLVMGLLSFFSLKRNTFPSVDFKIVFVTTVYPGAAAKDVEINVTVPLEEELLNVSGIKDINSYSTENISSVSITIDPNNPDPAKVKSDIAKAIDRVTDLPREVRGRPTLIELGSDIFPIFEVAVSGNVPELELRQYARTLEKKLKTVPGVGSIEKLGYRKREIRIEVDQRRLDDNYVSLNEVMGAIAASNVRLSGGSLQSVETKKNVVTLAQFARPLDVRSVIVRSVFSGRRILVSDIADVRDSFEKQDVIVKTDGQPCISLVINKKNEADAITTAAQVRRVLADYNQLLPPGVKTQKVRDYSVYVDSSLSNVLNNALVGFFLVVLCLVLWLDFWPALWTAIGIPASLLAGFYYMSFAGIAITNISLLAVIIVLGMLVDNGIVISEYIYQLREKGMTLKEAAVEGAYTIFWPVLSTVTTTIAAFLPILLMGGIFGDWLRSIPLVVTALLVASLVEAILILPAQLASSPGKLRPKPRTILILESWYQGLLTRVLRKKYWAIGAFMAALIFSLAVVLPLVGFELFPPTDNNVIQVRLEAPRGTPLMETNRRVALAEKAVVEAIPPKMLASYVTRVGEKLREAEDSFGVRQSHWGGIIVNLIPREKRSLSAYELKDRLDARLKPLKAELPVIDTIVSAGGPPVGKPVDVSLIGNNDEVRTALGNELYTKLSSRKGIFGLTRDDETGPREIGIKLDQGLMSELGLTALDVAMVIRAAFDGGVVTSVRDAAEEIDFRVIVKDEYKTDPAYIRNLTLSNRAGKLIKLGSFIRFEDKESPLGIPHRNGDRSLRIRAEVDRKLINPAELTREIRTWLEPKVVRHPEMRLRFGGLEESTLESLRDFFNAFIISLVAIYILLAVLFGSLSQPFIVMLAIPFGLIGVILAFALHLTPVTFIGLIGILGLSGVVVNNSLVMLSFLNTEEAKVCTRGHELNVDAIVAISVPRLRPIFLTTITTVAGLIPSVYGFFGGKIDELYPLLLAITYGLIFSTLITLFLIPAIYLAERDLSCWWFARFGRNGTK